MLLLEHPLSSYVQKVKIALREKRITFAMETPAELGSGRSGGAFKGANPRIGVPVLIDGSVRIFDCTIIMQYIEERWPDPPLLPRDPAPRAFARITEDVCDTQYEAVNWGLRRGALVPACDQHTGGDAAGGGGSPDHGVAVLADRAFGRRAVVRRRGVRLGRCRRRAMVNRSVHYGLGPSAGSPLAAWHARLRERPSVAATFAGFDAAAARMALNAGAYASGERRREYRDHRLKWMVKSGGIEVVLEGLRKNTIRFP